MKKFILAITIVAASVVASSAYADVVLQNNQECVGGTLAQTYADVQDTGASIDAKGLATEDCNWLTTPGQCCEVQYRRSTPAPPAIGSHVWTYGIYNSASLAATTCPTGTLTSSFQCWAGISGASNACEGTWAYVESDTSDLACVSGSSKCVPNPNNTNVYSALATCPSANPEGTACVVGSPVLLKGVKGPTTYGNRCKWNSVEGNSNLVQTSVYSCVGSSGAPVPLNCGTTPPPPPPPVTASLIANPPAIDQGEQSLLTWSSTGATECTGTDFSTSGTPSGNVLVRPAQTTTYSVRCSNSSNSATANASVTVRRPTPPPGGEPFSVSCRVTPSQIGINQPAIWSSSVTGPQGIYTYSWTGTDGLSGTASQVSKSYSSPGHKSGRLTVKYMPDHAVLRENGIFQAFAKLVSGLFTVVTVTEARAAGASCSRIVNQNQWYTGGTIDVIASERTTSPISCEFEALNAGYPYWNRSVENRCPTGGVGSLPCEYDPAQTTCYGVRNPTGLVSKPPVENQPNRYPEYFDSGNVCDGGGSQCPAGSSVALQGAMQCSGGTEVARGNDTQDGVHFGGGYNSEPWCDENTPVGGCCNIEVRENVGPTGQPINTLYFFKAYTGATLVQKDSYQTGITNKTNHNFFAGFASCATPAETCPWQMSYGDFISCDAPTQINMIPPGGPPTFPSDVHYVQIPGTSLGTCPGNDAPDTLPPNTKCKYDVIKEPDFRGSADCDVGSYAACFPPSGGGTPKSITTDCSGVVCTNPSCTCTGPGCGGTDVGGGGECSDGIDNDRDGNVDCADASCHTDGNAGNAASCNPGGLESTQCSDTRDNDGDTQTDARDPGCHSDSNASNAASYDPADNDESNTQCSDGIDNDGNSRADYQADGSGDPGCSSLNDDDESSNATLSLALAASSSVVQYGTPATLAWSATNVRAGSCRITGTNGVDYDYDSGPLGGTSGQVTTTGKPLKSQVTFTLSCRNLVGETVTKTAIVRVTPISGEI